MSKLKTSIYVDEELWDRFKRRSAVQGKEITRLLEEIIEEEMLEDSLDDTLSAMATGGSLELDFEPVKARTGGVSELIRSERDQRAGRLSGQLRDRQALRPGGR